MNRYCRTAAAMFLALCSTVSTAPAPAAALQWALGPKGLTTLTWNGKELLADAAAGQPEPSSNTPQLKRPDGTRYTMGAPPPEVHLDRRAGALIQTYPWGSIRWTYSHHGAVVTIRSTVRNTTGSALSVLQLKVVELTFPNVPQGNIPDPGMFGTARPHPLHEYPLSAPASQMPPVIGIDFGEGALAFCNESVTSPAVIGVPATSDPMSRRSYPLVVSLPPIPAGQSLSVTVSLRFGSPGATDRALAVDLFRAFARVHPFRLRWQDHRAIGANFLAGAPTHTPQNPRGWFFIGPEVDLRTDEGKQMFHRRLLEYADASIKVLKEMNAQGVITWDPEGEEFSQATYYGDPRLVSRLAPEMEGRDPTGLAAADAYFRRFRDVGLRVGVCIRPQQIRFVDGKPVQEDSPDPARTLSEKIRYARRRWGCTLFYVDSTVDAHGPLDAAVFEQVARRFPEVLLLPENQTYRYYDCTAPFDSFFHQGVTSTSAEVRAAYPEAFSGIYAPEDGPGGTLAGSQDALTAAVHHGDILLFHGWYGDPGNQQVKRIYEMAGKE